MDSAEPRPRLCHLRKSPDFAGYGFNLHAEKGKTGQFIGNVDPGSPAETAGLREGDRIVEVNGTNVSNENHSQVVERIKAVPGEVTFLVVDPSTDAFFRDNKTVITGDMDDIERIGDEAETVAPVEATEPAAEVAVSSAPDDSPTPPRSLHDDEGDETAAGPAAVVEEEEEVVVTSSAAEAVSAFSVTAAQDDHSPVKNGVTSTNEEQESHQPRLCELKLWSDFAGYGFNLHANRGEPEQFIGKIDAGSPAEHSGLREGDRIVEVNGVNIDDAVHADVVQLIKSVTGSVSLLVVDSKTDEHFKNHGLVISSQSSSIERITGPDRNPAAPVETIAAMSVDADAPPPAYVEAAAEAAPKQHPHRARLCVIYSWKDGRGYGFSMQAQKGDAKAGQFIGKIDAVSPAEAAGLRSGDRIVEVNGDNIETLTHKQVVEKIKSVPDLVRLLVVDQAADKYYAEQGITVSSAMDDCVERIESPATKPVTQHPHRARHCVIYSWKDGRGYGFSMQAQRGEASAGQFIGKIDAGSPAEAGGLRQGDRIIEVNGDNVEQSSHKEVVDKIKSVPDTVKLLVVDADADKYFKNASIKVSSSMQDCVEQITCPATKPGAAVAAFAAVNGDSGAKSATKHPHRARHCVIYSWKDGRGYGFSMQAQRGEASAGQFIGKIDAGSPAEAGGLRQGDRIIEVNGDNVEQSSHKEVVEKIKSVPDTVKLLVVDVDADKYFKNASIKVSSSMQDCVEQITCPATKPASGAVKPTLVVNTSSNEKPKTGATTSGSTSPTSPSSPPVVINGIEFAGSAQEARRRMSKKKSVTEDTRSMKAKYDLFQKM